MLRLTLAQMRRSLGRLTAAAVAIAIGSAFLATTLLAGGVITRTGYDAITATYGQADAVVRGTVSDRDLAALRALPDVQAADVLAPTGVEIRRGGESRWQIMLPTPTDPRLGSLTVSEGATPSAAGQVALPAATAKALRVGVGDQVQVRYSTPDASADATEPTWTEVTEDVLVVGIADDPADAWSQSGGAGLITPSDALLWSGTSSLTELGSTLLVVARDGVSPEQLRASIAPVVPDARAMTKDEAAADAVSELSDGGNVLVTTVLGFAAVAMLVAALVIANTFQVLVAQRTRTLAMLRCVGASKGQLRRSVLVEAGILGLVSSVVGLVAGTALAQIALVVLGRLDLGVPLPSTVHLTVAVVAVPLLVGTLVTLLASLVPAREATRVSPIAALRPADAPALGARGGRVRLAFSLVLVVGGAGVLLLASVLSSQQRGGAGLLLGVGLLAGAVSFVGVLIGAVFWVPRIVALVGRSLASTGTSARLAAANTVRNPRRTAATSTALLIGVTLVVMMSTGAASARSSMGRELDEHYPVDLTVDATTQGDPTGLSSDVLPAVQGVDGIQRAVAVRTAEVEIDGTWMTVAAPVDDAADQVLREPALLDRLADGTILLPAVADPKLAGAVTVTATDDTGGSPVPLDAVATDLGGRMALVTTATLDRLAPQAPVTAVWAILVPDAGAADVLQDVRQALPDTAADVSSAAAERVSYERLIDTLLGVVVGLLAVAVVIALIGVANTLSLSVLERRRESATLRAIGLSRRQLRWMLAIEGMLIAGVGAVLGAGLGLLYGWAGAAVVFGSVGDVLMTVPWRDLGIVLVVSLAAGLLASVLPGRAAARTSPVAALAVD